VSLQRVQLIVSLGIHRKSRAHFYFSVLCKQAFQQRPRTCCFLFDNYRMQSFVTMLCILAKFADCA
jgi:hypothetical protein